MKDFRYSGWVMPGKAASFTKELLVDAVSPSGVVAEEVKEEDVLRLHHRTETCLFVSADSSSLSPSVGHRAQLQLGATSLNHEAVSEPIGVQHIHKASLCSMGRLSVRHLSCSSPSLILSSSLRCSMMSADFILTKCS